MEVREVKRTRKAYACAVCGFLIEAGSPCVTATVGPHDHPDNDGWTTYRYHQGCDQVLVYFRKANAAVDPDCESARGLTGDLVLDDFFWRSTPETRGEVVALFDGAPPFAVQRLLWMCAWPTAEPRRPRNAELAFLLGQPTHLRAGDLWVHPDGRLLAVQATELWADGSLMGSPRLFQLLPEAKPFDRHYAAQASDRLLSAGWRLHSRPEPVAC